METSLVTFLTETNTRIHEDRIQTQQTDFIIENELKNFGDITSSLKLPGGPVGYLMYACAAEVNTYASVCACLSAKNMLQGG